MRGILVYLVMALAGAGCSVAPVLSAHVLIKSELAGVAADHRVLGEQAIAAREAEFRTQIDAALDKSMSDLAAAGLLTPANAKLAMKVNQDMRIAFARELAKDKAVLATTVDKLRRIAAALDILAAYHQRRYDLFGLSAGIGLDALQVREILTREQATQVGELLDIPTIGGE